jgi:hypothetical protein
VIVMPVQTGIQDSFPISNQRWIPACAGMTDGKAARVLKHVNDLRAAQKANAIRPYVPILTLRLRAFAGGISDCIS